MRKSLCKRVKYQYHEHILRGMISSETEILSVIDLKTNTTRRMIVMKRVVALILAICLSLTLILSAFAECSHQKYVVIESYVAYWPHRVSVNSCSQNPSAHTHLITDTRCVYIWACATCCKDGYSSYLTICSNEKCESPHPPVRYKADN